MSGSSPVRFKSYRLLDGSVKRLPQQVLDGSIIKRFDFTPRPRKLNDVVCPHFLELKWAYGCPFNCSWCYLKGTLRLLPTKTRPIVKDYKKIERHVEAFFGKKHKREILNSGEIADSLMWENNGNPFSKFIISLFEDSESKDKILFLTKSDNIQKLLSLRTNGCPIMSFTLNADVVAKKWEKGAPEVKRRIRAAKKLQEADYKVRIRIDPIVPIDNWKKHYKKLIDDIFLNLTPERITIGSLRGLQTTINHTKDKSWIVYLSEKSGWGKKVGFELRYGMYSYLINYLKEEYGYKKIGLCKETLGIWRELNMNYKKIRCNCIW